MLTELSQLYCLFLKIIFYSGALNVIVSSEFRILCNSSLGYSATQTYQIINY